jgi:uncharacterized membrane protein (UPF0127 family)
MRFLFSFFTIVIGFSFLSGSAAANDSKKSLPSTSLSIGKYQLDVQLALDETTREQGLMKRKTLGANEGMLFIFPSPQRVAFWMKDTSLPLSVAYLNSGGRIIEMHDLEPFNEHSVSSSSPAIVYVIEAPRGWFTMHQILPGDLVLGLPNFTTAK